MTTEVMIKNNGPKSITYSLVQDGKVISERSLFAEESQVLNVWQYQTISIRENENPPTEGTYHV